MTNWRFITRVIFKATLLFVVCNVLFALLNPIEALGSISLYNVIVPGRARLPPPTRLAAQVVGDAIVQLLDAVLAGFIIVRFRLELHDGPVAGPLPRRLARRRRAPRQPLEIAELRHPSMFGLPHLC